MERTLRRTPAHFGEQKTPQASRVACGVWAESWSRSARSVPGSEISGLGSVRSSRNGSSLDLEVVVCRNPGELDLAGWKHPVVDASGRGSVDLEACPPRDGAVIPDAHRVVAPGTRA